MSECLFDKTWNFIKRKLQHRRFSVNVAKFLRTLILKNTCERPLLQIPERQYSKRVLPYLSNEMSSLMEFVTCASWFSGHRFKLETEDFFLHIPQKISPWKYLFCVQQEVSGVFIFPYFVLSWYILAQRLVKTFLKWKYFFLFLFSSARVAYNCSK